MEPADFARVRFIEERSLQRALWQVGLASPERLRGLVIDQGIHLVTQLRARTVALQMIADHRIDLVFEPTPISPKGVSCMYGLGVPVVVGPLCGGLELPPAFRYMDNLSARLGVRLGRALSPLVHSLFPGKLEADAVLVGNARTAKVLPRGCRGKVYELPESGVDLSQFSSVPAASAEAGARPTRFVYLARFVDWKGIEFLVEAFAQVVEQVPAELELIGDGELFQATQQQVERLGLRGSVHFHGRLPLERAHTIVRGSDVYMAPSLRECGGCAILEAMAMAKPIVAAHWAGPAEFLEGGCAVLVEPHSRQQFIDGLAEGMVRLARSPELRRELGEAAAARIRSHAFDWDTKVDRLVEIFEETLERARNDGAQRPSRMMPAQGSSLQDLG